MQSIQSGQVSLSVSYRNRYAPYSRSAPRRSRPATTWWTIIGHYKWPITWPPSVWRFGGGGSRFRCRHQSRQAAA